MIGRSVTIVPCARETETKKGTLSLLPGLHAPFCLARVRDNGDSRGAVVCKPTEPTHQPVPTLNFRVCNSDSRGRADDRP